MSTGELPDPTPAASKDSDHALHLDTPIRHYTNNAVTKGFLSREARRMNPDFKQKSGAMYWINRWREDQLAAGKAITYGDLVKYFVELNQTKGRLPPIPSARFNNFVSDFLEHETGATRADALQAWDQLKIM